MLCSPTIHRDNRKATPGLLRHVRHTGRRGEEVAAPGVVCTTVLSPAIGSWGRSTETSLRIVMAMGKLRSAKELPRGKDSVASRDHYSSKKGLGDEVMRRSDMNQLAPSLVELAVFPPIVTDYCRTGWSGGGRPKR